MQQNVKLQPLSPLIGEWRLLGTHPYLPNRTLHGQATFEWIEGGAFLILRMHMGESEIPDGIAVFGTDDASNEGAMIYFDVRGVSREYRWTVAGNEWRWWRNAPDLSQRMVLTMSADGQTIESIGEMSRGGASWEPDLQLTFTRAVER